MRRSLLLTRLVSAKSTTRYRPPNGTADLARSAVSGPSRVPAPPASTRHNTLCLSIPELHAQLAVRPTRPPRPSSARRQTGRTAPGPAVPKVPDRVPQLMYPDG